MHISFSLYLLFVCFWFYWKVQDFCKINSETIRGFSFAHCGWAAELINFLAVARELQTIGTWNTWKHLFSIGTCSCLTQVPWISCFRLDLSHNSGHLLNRKAKNSELMSYGVILGIFLCILGLMHVGEHTFNLTFFPLSCYWKIWGWREFLSHCHDQIMYWCRNKGIRLEMGTLSSSSSLSTKPAGWS